MRIALICDATPNLNSLKDRSSSLSKPQSGLDVSSTVLSDLSALGYKAERVEWGGSLSSFTTHLEMAAADLALSLVQYGTSPSRNALLPALFEELKLPYVGSDSTCFQIAGSERLLTSILREHGLLPAGAMHLEASAQAELGGVRKIAVTFLGELLEPCQLVSLAPGVLASAGEAKDVELGSQGLPSYAPANLSKIEHTLIMDCARRVVSCLGLRDWGQIDLLLPKSGEVFVAKVDAAPKFGPGSALFTAANILWRRKKLSKEGLLRAITGRLLKSAMERASAKVKQSKPKRVYKVGVAYNLKRLDAEEILKDDSQAEFDSPDTVQALVDAIALLDYEVVRLEATEDFAQKAASSGVDLVFNIAEGIRGRNRESQVPSVLELLGIPYTGSDPSCLCLTLDKGLAKRIVGQAGVPTPRWTLMSTGKERLPKDFSFPLMVKPLSEGSSKGVGATSVVNTDTALRAVVSELARRYHQPTLVEEFVGGREFTVGVIGEKHLKVLPVMEVVFTDEGVPNPIYGYEQKMHDAKGVRFDCPAKLDHGLHKLIVSQAKATFRALGCRDVARIDFRMDLKGRVHFIECNPLPGLAPNFSDLAVIATAAGMSYQQLVQEILSFAVRRARVSRGGHTKVKQHAASS